MKNDLARVSIVKETPAAFVMWDSVEENRWREKVDDLMLLLFAAIFHFRI